jgi:hypothetical protein
MNRNTSMIGLGNLVCLALLSFGTQSSFGQAIPLEKMEQTVKTLVGSPWFPSEKESRQAYENILQSSTNDQLALVIAELAHSRPIDINGLYALRMIGSHARSEFETAVTSRLKGNQDPVALGRLALLLRNAKPPLDVSLLHLLNDKRAAETLDGDDMGKRAHGGSPFRVCDIAYNVIQEIRASNESVDRSSPPDVRDSSIANLRPPTNGPDDLSSKGQTATSLEVLQPPAPKVSEAKPTPTSSQSEKPGSSTPWSIIVVLILAASGLLWLLVKMRK